MSEHRLSDEELRKRLREATMWHFPDEIAIYGELLARRAADPTTEQRAWYREQAQLFGGVGAVNLKAAEDYWQTGPHYVRLAAHFGRLALEGDE